MAFSIQVDDFADRIRRTFDQAIKEEIDKEVEFARQRVETNVRKRCAALAVSLLSEVDIRRQENRIVVTFRTDAPAERKP